MTRTVVYLLFFITGLGALPRGRAQSAGLETISIEQGLSQGFIAGMCQDSEGFLWFATKSGLNRYDGYGFLTFKKDAYDPYSLSDNQLTNICEVGEFLCVIAGDGVNLFHRRTQRFYQLPPDRRLPAHDVAECRAENAHTVWITMLHVNDWRCYRITWPEDLPARLPHDTAALADVRVEPIFADRQPTSLVVSADGQTRWLATARGQLARQSPADDRPTEIALPAPDIRARWLLAAGNEGVLLWAEATDRVAWYNPQAPDGRYWRTWRREPNANLRLLAFDAQRRLLWACSGIEVRGYDLNRSFDLLDRAHARFILTVPEIARCGITDRNGMLWLGTNAHGIRKFNPNTGLFQHFLEKQSIYARPVADATGRIWLGDLGYNLLNRVLDRTDGSLRPYPVAALAPFEPVRTVATPDGALWLTGAAASDRGVVLVRYDPHSGREETFPYPEALALNRSAMYFDAADQAIWTSDEQQLVRFDLATRTFATWRITVIAAASSGAYAVERTADGSIWIATDQGLVRGRPQPDGTLAFELLKNDPANRNSLPANRLKCLLADPSDGHVLWIGTGGSGLCRYDLRTASFRHFNTRDGLPDDVVYGIVSENRDPAQPETVLWLSTNKGLARFQPEQHNFRYFLQSDGLQENEFNTYAYGKTPGGELMFGGVNGLTVFDPRTLNASALPADVHITALRVNNRLLLPGDSSGLLRESIEFTTELDLAHDQNNLYIQFMATDLTQPAQNQFRYYLEGAEAEWAHAGFEHSAQYLNLSPGTYTFKVMAANSDGVWNRQPTLLHIRIRPPWYASIWAYLAYALVVGLGIRLAYRHQLRERLKHAETERLKELDTFKTRFFTNITHEFRTPLTVILGMAERLENDPARGNGAPNAATLIRRNGQNLLQLINQILDLSKLESGKLRLQPEQADIVAFARYVVESFQSWAASRTIRLHFLAETAQLTMDFDREKMQSILANLLSNAIKFTPAEGDIYLHIAATARDGQACCEIRVRDTGRGIAADQLDRVFDRFYQVDGSSTRAGEGTGIGLALTRELVRLMDGTIAVSSPVAGSTKGAVFTVTLPVTTRSEPAGDLRPATIVPAPEPAARPVAATADAGEKPVVLVVEDNDDVRQYLVACVAPRYHVLEARDGVEGLALALEHVPDLVVSDVMMPRRDGFELCRLLKDDARTSHIPLVLLTARADARSRIEGLTRGADDYIAKPFDADELLVRLHNLLENRRRLQARFAALPLPPAGEDADLKIEDAFLQRFKAVVEANLSDADFEMPQLERALGMSRSQIFRKLKALTGQAPSLYVRTIRLHKAQELLGDRRRTVAEVAYEVGFTSPAYFSTAFLEEFGQTPGDFRQA
jgi:signal transduction histidine kinase/DNA-binding response OmpR family regulator/streptogramin lyase